MTPGTEIPIVFTGVRPGERLNEILFGREEPAIDIGIPGVVAAPTKFPSLDMMRERLNVLREALVLDDQTTVMRVLREVVPDFQGKAV